MLRARRRPGQAASSSGWQLPPDADARQSPLTADAKVLAAGKAFFKDKCTRCHGRRASATVPTPIRITAKTWIYGGKRADRNSDGVVFYKVSNGRRRPKMPAFRDGSPNSKSGPSSLTYRNAAEEIAIGN